MALPVLDEEELLPALPEGLQRLWPHQEAPVRRITEMFQAGARMVVLDAPPGAGKSLIAESVRRRLRVQALYLCQTKQLQGQITRTFPYARLIMGRDNYPTLDDFARTTKDCDSWRKKCVAKPSRGCVITGPHCSWCHPTFSCPYALAKGAALHAPLAVANTSYAFLEWGAQGQFKDWPLVILDEWDQVEDVLFNTLNVQISARELGRFKLAFPDRPVDADWVRTAAKAVGEVYNQSADNPPDDWPRIGELAIGLRRAAEGLKDGSWIVLEQDLLTGVSVGPIEVGKLGQQYLWPHGRRWLLMSGTAIDIRLRLLKLGWTDFGSKGQPGKGRVLQVPSVYPVANRPVRVWPIAPMTKDKREASLPKMVVAIEKILDAHADERVLIHSGTYAIAAALEAALTRYRSRLVTFTKARDRQDAIDRYLARERAVLIGPAMERGVDLPDEACRVVVILRVPYPYQGDPRVRERSKQGGPWWVLQAIETIAALIQMTGRGMRHADDFCACVAPETRVLTGDLRWVPAGDLRVGQCLVGFDEHGRGRGHPRCHRWSTVVAHQVRTMPRMLVVLETGQALVCTPEHPWLLVNRGKTHGWVRTADLKAGDRFVQVINPWNEIAGDEQYMTGWLAGFFDGEGCLSIGLGKRNPSVFGLQASQKLGSVMTQAQEYLTRLGFDHKTYPTTNAFALNVRGGLSEILRFLGQVRPIRLLEKYRDSQRCERVLGYGSGVRVAAVEHIDPGPIAAMQTSTATYIAEGFGAHNSYILDSQFQKIRTNELYTNRMPKWWADSLVDFKGEW